MEATHNGTVTVDTDK